MFFFLIQLLQVYKLFQLNSVIIIIILIKKDAFTKGFNLFLAYSIVLKSFLLIL